MEPSVGSRAEEDQHHTRQPDSRSSAPAFGVPRRCAHRRRRPVGALAYVPRVQRRQLRGLLVPDVILTLIGVMFLSAGLADDLNWVGIGLGSFFLLAGVWNLLMVHRHQRRADAP